MVGIVGWDRGDTEAGAHDIAGNNTCRIAVAVVVDGGNDGVVEIVGIAETAVNRNSDGFFGGPTFAEGADVFDIVDIITGKFKSIAHNLHEVDLILTMEVLGGELIGEFKGNMELFAEFALGVVHDFKIKSAEESGRNNSERMAVREGGGFGGDLDSFVDVLGGEANWSNAHSGAATFALVNWFFDSALFFTGKCAETSEAWSAAMINFWKLVDPRDVDLWVGFGIVLGMIPIKISTTDAFSLGWEVFSEDGGSIVPKECICSKKHHLSVVRKNTIIIVVSGKLTFFEIFFEFALVT